jgi:hypothetical protein
MLAPANATIDTMQHAVAYTIAALDAAIDLDTDRSADDQAFFINERANMESVFTTLNNAGQAFVLHTIKESVRLQARVIVGDAVLDRGVSMAKQRMKVALQLIRAEAADSVFGSNISKLVEAKLRKEPLLVRQAIDRFDLVPDFAGKAEIKEDLSQRVDRQIAALAARDEGEVTRARLNSALVNAIADASEALYRMEKRMLARFPKERSYVKGFFFDVAPARKPKAVPQPTP